MRACPSDKHAAEPSRTEYFGRRTPYLAPGPFNREHMLGSIVNLMALSPVHRGWSVADIERLVACPLALGQFFAFADGFRLIGWISWARLTATAEAGFVTRSRRLAPEDWNAGDRVWLVDFVAPLGGVFAIVRRARAELSALAAKQDWPADEARWLRRRPDGSIRHQGRAARVA